MFPTVMFVIFSRCLRGGFYLILGIQTTLNQIPLLFIGPLWLRPLLLLPVWSCLMGMQIQKDQ